MNKVVALLGAISVGTFASANPVEPVNRFTIDGAIPVVNLLYKGQYNTLHGGNLPKSFDLLTIGDSITCNWSVRDRDGYYQLSPKGYPDGVFNLGIGGDRIEHVLWRLEDGKLLENFTTKYFTLLIGTNNSYQRRIEQNVACDKPEEMVKGIERIIGDLKAKHPEAKILLMPILPYEFLHDSRAVDCRANNEKVNDLIIKFVDNRQVFWLDLRGKLLNDDGTFRDEYWSASGEPGSDGKGHYLHPSGKAYQKVFDPSVAAAMKKLDAAPAGTAQETDPSIGYAVAAVDGAKGFVTVTLHGVYPGTDSKGVPSDRYYVEYQLDDGKWRPALDWQGVPTSRFVIPGVAVGKHTCEIRVTTSARKTVTATSVFTMCDAWSAERLTADASCVRTDGELVYAYGLRDYSPKGVKFVKLSANENDDLKWGITMGFTTTHPAPKGVEDKEYASLLGSGWWVPGQTGGSKVPLVLKKLTPGEKYLVQIFAYRSAFNAGNIWIDGTDQFANFIKAGSGDWTCGGTLICTFTADASTKEITIMIEGQSALNAVQVRKLLK